MPPPQSGRGMRSSERPLATSSRSDALAGGQRADLVRGRARHDQSVGALELDRAARAAQKRRQPAGIFALRTSVPPAPSRPSTSSTEPLARRTPGRSRPRRPRAQRHLGEDGSTRVRRGRARPRRAAGRAPSECRVGRVRWWARRGSEPWVAEQRGGYREPLAHAHRVVLHAPAGRPAGVDEAEYLVDPRVGVTAGRGEHTQVVATAATDGSSPPRAPRRRALGRASCGRGGRRRCPHRSPSGLGRAACAASCSCPRRSVR